MSILQDLPGGPPSAGGRKVMLDHAKWMRTPSLDGSRPVRTNFNPVDNHGHPAILDSIYYRYETGRGF